MAGSAMATFGPNKAPPLQVGTTMLHSKGTQINRISQNGCISSGVRSTALKHIQKSLNAPECLHGSGSFH